MNAILLALAALVAANASTADDAELRWSIYARCAGSVYSSSARTMGGTGGALGLRLSSNALIVQSELGLLTGLGTVMDWRVAAGAQASIGDWTPTLLATFSLMAGDQLSYLSDEHTLPLRGPAASLGLDLEALRFSSGRTSISILALGAGLGSDFPGLGVALRLGLFELAAAF